MVINEDSHQAAGHSSSSPSSQPADDDLQVKRFIEETNFRDVRLNSVQSLSLQNGSLKRMADRADDHREYRVGIGRWSPDWLQWACSPGFFVLYFSFMGLLLKASSTNYLGLLSTLERRFGLDTKQSGSLLIMDNISGLIAGPIIGHLATRVKSRPALLGAGNLIIAAAYLLSATPFFIYGPATHLLEQDAANVTKPGKHPKNLRVELCELDDDQDDSDSPDFWGNLTTKMINWQEQCEAEDAKGQQDGSRGTFGPIVILWAASFISGIGSRTFHIVGWPYIDDNVPKHRTPVYLAISAVLRQFGPTAGFLVSGFALRYYENPFMDPGITQDDPRWIGAWWVGFLLLGTLVAIFTLPMFLFPNQFKTPEKSVRETDSGKGGSSLRRLFTTPLFLVLAIGVSIRAMGHRGYRMLKPKYIETQYRQSSSNASFFTGTTNLISIAVGIASGGWAITKFKPSAKFLTGCLAFVHFITVVTMLGAVFLGCPSPFFPQLHQDSPARGQDMIGGGLDQCNAECGCTTEVFNPVCGPDGVSNYFSPCYAGCNTSSPSEDSKKTIFEQCICIDGSGPVTSGYCPTDCHNLWWYLLLLAVSAIVTSTTRIGGSIIVLRCVDPKDKSIALGWFGTILSVLTFIPSPIIFGQIADSSCAVWESTRCGKRGNCWLYDADVFRKLLHGWAISFMAVGSLFDIGVFILSAKLHNLYDDDHVDQKKISKRTADKEVQQLKMTPLAYSSS